MSKPPGGARVLRLKELMLRVGLGRSTIYEYLNPLSPRFVPDFPKPIKLGASSVGWLEPEVDGWIERRVAAREAAKNQVDKLLRRLAE